MTDGGEVLCKAERDLLLRSEGHCHLSRWEVMGATGHNNIYYIIIEMDHHPLCTNRLPQRMQGKYGRTQVRK